MTSDSQLAAKIEELVAEEHQLANVDPDESADQDRHARLQEVKVELDRCWDLLRQRRAREEFGQDPNDATARSADVVENYEQ
jgi:hypothetical protein